MLRLSQTRPPELEAVGRLPRSPAEKHPPLPASIPRVPEMPEVGRRNGAPPSVPRPCGHCAPRGHQGARGHKGVQGCHKRAFLITGSAGSAVPHPATAPKDRSGRPEQGRGAIGKRSSSWKGNPKDRWTWTNSRRAKVWERNVCLSGSSDLKGAQELRRQRRGDEETPAREWRPVHLCVESDDLPLTF